MRIANRRNAWLVALAAPLVLGACAGEQPRASSADVDRAVTAADQGKAEAAKAMQTAQQALQTAQKAENDAQAANQRADKMYDRSLRK
ncbi:MAG TPA: alanine-zipper protein [Stellaceae bacterium]|nr:alanine-zipper protein [Stellaceae bacterium]